MTVVIATHVGAGRLRGCVVRDGVMGDITSYDTPPRSKDADKNAWFIVEGIAELVQDLQAQTPGVGCVAVSCPGIMKLADHSGARASGPLRDHDVVVTGVNLGLVNYPLQVALEERLSLPVHIENDGNAALCSVDDSDVLLVTHGSGISLAVKKKNEIVRLDGSWGCFEIGHGFRMPLRESLTRRCHCAATGCLEAAIGGWALAERFGVEPEHANKTVFAEMRASVLELLPHVLANSVDRFGVPNVVLAGRVATGFAKGFDYAAAIKEKVDARRTGYNIDTAVRMMDDAGTATLRGVARAAVDTGTCG